VQHLGRGDFFCGVESHHFFGCFRIYHKTTRFCEEVVELDAAKMYGNFDVFGFLLFLEAEKKSQQQKNTKSPQNFSRLENCWWSQKKCLFHYFQTRKK